VISYNVQVIPGTRMLTLLEGTLAVHSQGVSSNVRGLTYNTPRGADRTLVFKYADGRVLLLS